MNSKSEKVYLDLTILGCAGTYPCKDRGLSAIYGITHSSKFLLDVGEGTQKKLLENEMSQDLDWVFISHYHADHYLGLFGYLSTQKLKNRVRPLTVYCPDKEYLERCLKTLGMGYLLQPDNSYKLNLKNIVTEVVYYEKDLCLEFFLRDHHTMCSGSHFRTYGIHVYSAISQKYDKEKLKELPESIKSELFVKKSLTVNNESYNLEDFLLSTIPAINFIYTSDGVWDSSVISRLTSQNSKTGLLVTECTHYFEEDLQHSATTKHTHYRDITAHLKCKDITFLLTHLGSKITPKLISNFPKKENVHWAYDNIHVQHNNLIGFNNVSKYA